MKKIKSILLALTIITTSSIIWSCSQEETSSQNEKLSKNQIENLKAYIYKSTVKGETNKSISDYNFDASIIRDYNFDDVKIVKSETGEDFAVINSNNFDIRNKRNKAIFLGFNGVDFDGTPMLTETINEDNGLKSINLSSIDDELLITIGIDTSNEKVDVTYFNKNPKKTDCGQALADCLLAAYSENHGWATVALYVTTVLVPETSLVIMAACYDKNCK